MTGLDPRDVTVAVERDFSTALMNMQAILVKLSRNECWLYEVPSELSSCQNDLMAIAYTRKINKVKEVQNRQTEQHNGLRLTLSQILEDIEINEKEKKKKKNRYVEKTEARHMSFLMNLAKEKIQNTLDNITEQNDILETLKGMSNIIKEFQNVTNQANEECRTILNTIMEFQKMVSSDDKNAIGLTENCVAMLKIGFPTDTSKEKPTLKSFVPQISLIGKLLEQLSSTIKECNLLLKQLTTMPDTIKNQNLITKFEECIELLNTLTQKPRSEELKRRTKSEVEEFGQLTGGLEVSFPRTSYKHHAITLRINEYSQTIELEHLTGNSTDSAVASIFSGGKASLVKQQITFRENGTILRYDYGNLAFPNKIIVRRAEIVYEVFQTLGEEYNVLKFNCQHFASYCVTGSFYCGQIASLGLAALNDELRMKMNTCVCRFILKELKEQYKCLM